ncbi:M56 family metallopeptidase [Dyadobacter sp. CY326]|uniref:M56 family metallopeptidase n=1 Tax=Dyadobacter sp. CY326 TaxID=2907300 RepID=UPI001F2E70F2|nr:M56 family metallopeptidase [Dyadobacter sp. CY326]MCE7068594.1 M56 family metallopeptidase [Dyadobacter sp. CY326]
MTELPEYLVKLSVGLAVTSLFYYAVLRRHTFYNWNRWYLLLYSMLAFCIPFIDVSSFVSEQRLGASDWVQQVPRVSHYVEATAVATPLSSAEQQEPVNWLAIIFIAGIIAMTARFCLNFYLYIRIKRKARLVSEDIAKLYHIDREIVPFSFGNAIFVNPKMHQEDELEKIILHEYVHVQQKHTFDNIWAEMLCILNWYNPFAWLIRYAIRQNLEYIADDQVLKNDVDAKQYQYLLLKVTGVPAYRLTNQFNFASLKQRIIMMNKARTPKIYLTRFLFVLPLLLVMLVAFRPALEEIDTLSSKGVFLKYPAKPDPIQDLIENENIEEDFGYCAGILLDAATGEPIANARIELLEEKDVVKTFKTDNQGYYFTEVGPDTVTNGYYFRSLRLVHPNYRDFVKEMYTRGLNLGYGRLSISFIPAKNDSTIRGRYYNPRHKKYPEKANPRNVKSEVRDYLSQLLSFYRTEIQLLTDFKKYHPFPKNVITKFRNGYFDRRSEFLGYEGITELYLDGKRATHTEVNEAFRSSPYLLDDTRLSKEWGHDGTYTKLKYLSFPLYKDAPSAALLPGNAETQNASTFDISVLDNEAYFLDGFRQVYGTGSNIKPLKSEIKRVVLFKGKLARYYDPKLEKVWWIETRPENEVFGRPDLAKN